MQYILKIILFHERTVGGCLLQGPRSCKLIFPSNKETILFAKTVWYKKEYTHLNKEKIFCTFRAVNFLFLHTVHVIGIAQREMMKIPS